VEVEDTREFETSFVGLAQLDCYLSENCGIIAAGIAEPWFFDECNGLLAIRA
jgi:hypothetical protein